MKTSTLRWILVAVVAAIALAGGLYFGQQRAAPPKAGPAQPAAAAAIANLALPDPQGKEQRLDQWRGKVLVVNFWATWCAPCREEMPEFIRWCNERDLPVNIDDSSFSMDIYNRWGMKVYGSVNSSVGWNGKLDNSGEPVPDGTYFVVLTYSAYCDNKQPVTVTGHVTLLR